MLYAVSRPSSLTTVFEAPMSSAAGVIVSTQVRILILFGMETFQPRTLSVRMASTAAGSSSSSTSKAR